MIASWLPEGGPPGAVQAGALPSSPPESADAVAITSANRNAVSVISPSVAHRNAPQNIRPEKRLRGRLFLQPPHFRSPFFTIA
jgi:hypothetical protein